MARRFEQVHECRSVSDLTMYVQLWVSRFRWSHLCPGTLMATADIQRSILQAMRIKVHKLVPSLPCLFFVQRIAL